MIVVRHPIGQTLVNSAANRAVVSGAQVALDWQNVPAGTRPSYSTAIARAGAGTFTATGSANTPASTAIGDSGKNQMGTNSQQTASGFTLYQNLSGSTVTDKLAAAGATTVSLPVGTQTFSNFGAGTGNSGQGVRLSSTLRGLVGAGSTQSTLAMTANTSTHAEGVPTQSEGGTNQLQYVYVAQPYNGFVWDGIMMLGTEQGHLYNGLAITNAQNMTISNSSFNHIPGDAGSPPGETFAVNLYAQEATGVTVTFKNVTVDGQGVTAAGLGVNRARGTLEFVNTDTKNCQYSPGIALWQIGETCVVNIRNSRMSGNRRNLGLEAHGGVVNVYDPVWGDHFASVGHDVNLTWSISSGETWVGGELNFYFSSASAWQAFIANRTVKKITIITNPRQDYGSGVVSNPPDLWNSCHVFVAGVEQTSTNYITFSGARI